MISIIIVTYNRNKDLDNLLSSINNQHIDKKTFEVIIVDNSSDYNAKNIVEKYQKDLDIQYIGNGENVGASKGRNIGIKKSKYEYILFLDDDNYLQDNNLKDILKNIPKLKSENNIAAIKYSNNPNNKLKGK